MPKGKYPRRGLILRFWDKVDRRGPDECWLWKACRFFEGGYGKLCLPGQRSVSAHKFSYELHYGKVPSGLQVLHSCDVKICCNPNHLFAGTQKENMEDMHLKGRGVYGDMHWTRSNPESVRRGESHGCAKLREYQVLQIRRRASQGELAPSIAKDFKVSQSTVYLILQGKIWKHITL